MMKDVTIIVPVYNVKDYLYRCLSSLVNQNYDSNKYEIYIVDDASTDGSLNIALEFKSKYGNIVVNSLKKNMGVSNARNIAIKNAKGKYLMFCDSDDYYDENALKKFMSMVKKYNADFVMANYYITNGKRNIPVDVSNYFKNIVLSKEEIVSYMTLTSSSKLIKRDLFINNDIYYPLDLKRCEELSVIPVLAYLAKKVVIISDCLYYYYQRPNSASNTNYSDISVGDIDYFDKSFVRFGKKIDGDKYFQEIEFRAIDHLLYGKTLVMLKSKIEKYEVLSFIDEFKKMYPNFINNFYLKKFSLAKKAFIYTINYKCLLIAKLFAFIHGKLTG